MDEQQWWYCLVHKAVEPAEGCRNADRLGPFATRAEAENALRLAEQRNEAWEHDPRWSDDD
ncbi:MAG: hypothetical protein GEV07_16455 [Streptosporangiales bacterium]|nr:hypothetical protein [Streptosporangiales bacterium]